jgi:hypothetical protein
MCVTIKTRHKSFMVIRGRWCGLVVPWWWALITYVGRIEGKFTSAAAAFLQQLEATESCFNPDESANSEIDQ